MSTPDAAAGASGHEADAEVWAPSMVWWAVAVGVLLRWFPLAIWGFGATVRDESQYVNLGRNILQGNGLINPQDWLWAPGYPYLIAAFQGVFALPVVRTLPWFQGALGALTCVVMYRITRRVMDERAARISAWLYALHPTVIFFSGRLWCEAIYGPVLLGAILALLWAREGRRERGLLPGFLLGLCVLLRGVATYIPPLFVIAALWPGRDETFGGAIRARAQTAVAVVLAVGLTVAPYSMSASAKHGGLIVSDATIGNLMYLGNNDFEPITFDYGNGVFKYSARGASVRLGRRPCPHATPPKWNKCEWERGMEWIRANPGEFFGRVPMRTAQLVNPHSFLTRAIRWGKYTGLPFWLKEALVFWVCGWSFLVLVGGTLGAAARARGPYAWMAIGIVTYTVAASAALYGLTRFRIPLEPLWMVFLAGFLANPKESLSALKGDRIRLATAAVMVPLLVVHMLWFLPSAWPGFNW